MFESFEKDNMEHTRSWVARMAAFFAILLVVSFGLCGLTAAGSQWLGNATVTLGFLELAGMVIGAGGLLFMGVVAVVLAMVGTFRR